MQNLLSQLTNLEQARLLEELNYMNLEEIRDFCSARRIPYKILAAYPNGKVKVTKDPDRKPIVLARLAVTSRQAKSVDPRASPRRSSARTIRRRGLDRATACTIAGTRRSTGVSRGCSAT